jgi:hypothetical protein
MVKRWLTCRRSAEHDPTARVPGFQIEPSGAEAKLAALVARAPCQMTAGAIARAEHATAAPFTGDPRGSTTRP